MGLPLAPYGRPAEHPIALHCTALLCCAPHANDNADGLDDLEPAP
ncbi:hypothetical protein ACGFYP_29300 [Streptomyces sp. NPDC048370]